MKAASEASEDQMQAELPPTKFSIEMTVGSKTQGWVSTIAWS
jgi:hypothetical protein